MKLLIGLLLTSTTVHAKGFGAQGAVYPIHEKSPLTIIGEKLQTMQDGGLEGLKSSLIKRVQKGLRSAFSPLPGWSATQAPRSFEVDPTVTVPFDLKDHKGRVFHKKSEKFNPLTLMPMNKTLLFIDGRDEKQVTWALEQQTDKSKIILVAGAPILLTEEHETPFYFDQRAVLLKKFKIQQIPAQVIIRDGRIRVSEMKLEEGK